MKLPGQSRHASKRLKSAIQEVQTRLSRPIVFLDITAYPDRLMGERVQGYHDSLEVTERIWLNPSIPYTAQEAIAAHELAHIVQKIDAFPQAISIKNTADQPLVPVLEKLSARINNLVMDYLADRWAASRSFDMGKALASIGLAGITAQIKSLPTALESTNWAEYYAQLKQLTQSVASSRPPGAKELRPEVNTQIMALDYAGLYLRLGHSATFAKLDKLWAERWPVSRTMGQELAALVKQNGGNDCRHCLEALRAIIACLRIPPPLISVTTVAQDLWPQN